ncbi:DUF423 domain-containing protein [Pollutimonas bauzanensis]|uniref:Uncharacterized membrane protein YgdD, TMEM256/DUF423 family n=1 Tax=Pollutimonas bauzanensis TaxID=658167 RepID=A0A1M5ZGF5_9BURK|nr:DUF423 domain-containing protein [Pollutimonas bauzanensis]SHI23221.1 Uncharacterized membrane protein YgdD, TMEM256/DUF423 family [Pollutimonas bauzanensis]
MTDRQLVIVASLTLLVGVGAGAFGAHGLKRLISPDLLAVWQTAVLYQLVHGLGMLAIAALAGRFGSALLSGAGSLMFAGIVIFSGSLYVLALTGSKWLGAVTPIGGLAFLAAWGMVALAAYRAA